MLPSLRYNELTARKRFSRDLTQEHAVVVLDNIFQQLLERKKSHTQPFFEGVFAKVFRKNKAIKGCYLWGGVGRGKTFLMDLFYDVLPTKNKKRLHFHHFMKEIHHRLGQIKQQKNPLQIIAKELSDEFNVLCLDEFMVHDIGDAMILSKLLSAMNQQGIVLLTTSNSAPENLYLDGLQRAQFLQTIALLNQHCHVLHIDGGIDYRTEEALFNRVFFIGDEIENKHRIEHWLKLHHFSSNTKDKSIDIQSRKIEVLSGYEQAIWFEFSALCKTNRSRSDYIELSQRFKTIIISGLHTMNDQANDVIRRFITLVDVFYDAKIVLVLSSEVNIEALYKGQFLDFEFRRTASRLYEMQSEQYVSPNRI